MGEQVGNTQRASQGRKERQPVVLRLGQALPAQRVRPRIERRVTQGHSESSGIQALLAGAAVAERRGE